MLSLVFHSAVVHDMPGMLLALSPRYSAGYAIYVRTVSYPPSASFRVVEHSDLKPFILYIFRDARPWVSANCTLRLAHLIIRQATSARPKPPNLEPCPRPRLALVATLPIICSRFDSHDCFQELIRIDRL